MTMILICFTIVVFIIEIILITKNFNWCANHPIQWLLLKLSALISLSVLVYNATDKIESDFFLIMCCIMAVLVYDIVLTRQLLKSRKKR